jgi:hypothetical protein
MGRPRGREHEGHGPTRLFGFGFFNGDGIVHILDKLTS